MSESRPEATPRRGSETDRPVTELLQAWRRGEEAAEEHLVDLLYTQLRGLAESFFRGEGKGHTLQPTALVHETYLRLLGQAEVDWQSRGHFFAIAARMMRRVLVDHARTRGRKKRGGDAERVPLELAGEELFAVGDPQLLDLDRALERLQELDPTKARLVELRFFAGLSAEETAQVLEISPATFYRQWRLAKAWLFTAVHGDSEPRQENRVAEKEAGD